jgi:carboxymethylenebutenolidase
LGSITPVGIPTGGRELPAAFALPSGTGRHPAVVVIHELFGLNDDIRAIAGRFADAGYVAIAPDFLAGLGPRPLCIVRFAQGLGRVGTGRPYRQLAAVRRWLATRPEVDARRVGVAGFCIGGGLALLYAEAAADLAVVAPFYAPVTTDAERDARRLCPTVASYGGRDAIFGGMGARLEAALTSAGVEHDIKTYPSAGHSFMSRHDGLSGWLGPRTPLRARYDARAADDAWRRVLTFFAKHLQTADRTPAQPTAEPV